ncbi:bifunctional enoyl-CoA hydratase/phosphate acetyltransferase [Athalassotoga saccharophila]|uniref:bifunctional enoyl-CoA hydratase/phosphate acetyltransferase n=1 Tax=Athalassotoga saccharophila TaxID=1441386 RepID=UPI001379A345|nr:bifunctional enoyl-CoA hydratase/phosphate acetyltransferase [Athalassotoga saccharophila]BBJ28916.1 phosphate acetyltransferase [Athalassotoga saccharophila]
MKTFEEVFEAVKERKKRVVLVGSEDKESIIALNEAVDRGFVDGILVGDGKVTKANLESLGIRDKFEIIDSDPHKSSETGVKIVSSGKGDILMKGLVKTSDLLKAVLNPEWGLRTGSLLSHLTVVEAKDYGRFIGITDGGMIIRPTLDQKVQIIKNAVSFFKKLGVSLPKVACIAAVEVVNPEIPETVEAAELAAMGKRKQIEGCVIDGPLGFDNAIDERAARVKGVGGDVAGHADILIVPEINSGNFIGKSMDYCAHYTIGGIILGAKVPIIVVSRADEARAKLASISLGALE